MNEVQHEYSVNTFEVRLYFRKSSLTFLIQAKDSASKSATLLYCKESVVFFNLNKSTISLSRARTHTHARTRSCFHIHKQCPMIDTFVVEQILNGELSWDKSVLAAVRRQNCVDWQLAHRVIYSIVTASLRLSIMISILPSDDVEDRHLMQSAVEAAMSMLWDCDYRIGCRKGSETLSNLSTDRKRATRISCRS